ncbi:MAG: hypothetical protein WEF50_12510 [Myxococcota bacterium]
MSRELASAGAARAEQEKVYVLAREALRGADDELFAELCADARLRDAAWFLTRVRERARWSMSAPEESLAADLDANADPTRPIDFARLRLAARACGACVPARRRLRAGTSVEVSADG